MATIFTSLTLKMFWKGYDIETPRTFLRCELIKRVTQAGEDKGVYWPENSPTFLNFGNTGGPKYPTEIIQKFLDTFHEEIFVKDYCEVRIMTLPKAECTISHEMYTPMAVILSPLTEPEYLGAMKCFMQAVNGKRLAKNGYLVTPSMTM